MLAHATGKSLEGKQFKLDWSSAPNGHPAQVEWIEIEYQEVLPASQGTCSGFTDFTIKHLQGCPTIKLLDFEHQI